MIVQPGEGVAARVRVGRGGRLRWEERERHKEGEYMGDVAISFLPPNGYYVPIFIVSNGLASRAY